MCANQGIFQEVREMFDALRDLMKEDLEAARKEGLDEGFEYGKAQEIERGVRIVIETCQEVGLSREKSENKVCTKFQLTEEKTKNYMDQFWK